MPPKQENKTDRRRAIFEAACRVIREKGFHQARMADIAQAAGISYGLVYHYFASKADLFDAILAEWWRGLEALTETPSEGELSIEESLAAIINYFLDQYEQRPDLVHIFITEVSRSAANLTPDRLNGIKLFIAKTEKIIARAQTQGLLRSDFKARYLSYVFLGALEGFISTLVLEGRPLKGRAQKERIARALLRLFLDGARPPGAGAA